MQLEMRAVKLKVLIKTELVLKYRANSTKYSEDPKPNMFGIQMLKNVRLVYVLFSDDDLNIKRPVIHTSRTYIT